MDLQQKSSDQQKQAPTTTPTPTPVPPTADVVPKPDSVQGENKYAILQETVGNYQESWLYFIKHNGNEEALQHLNDQLDQVSWILYDDMSTFDLELNYLVSEQTARDMTKVDLNANSAHRKFDGKLKNIDFRLSSSDKNRRKIYKVCKLLEYGRIDEYVDQEDVDPNDLVVEHDDDDEDDEDDFDSDSDSGSEEEETSSSSRSSSSSSEDSSSVREKKKGKLPQVVKKIEIPRIAAAKQANKKKREEKHSEKHGEKHGEKRDEKRNEKHSEKHKDEKRDDKHSEKHKHKHNKHH